MTNSEDRRGSADLIATPTSIEASGEYGESPKRIGSYRIVRELGHGGMGVVYLAEQTGPVRREVAIKLLQAGVASDQFVARFDTERQALAVMEHPNITKVFDAGVTEAGQPYFVMELVSGAPLSEFADAHRLTIPERLRLFVQTCHAVQHAHQKGIIHRDIKPSNVLVTEADGGPQCKVIDFGIAKATEGADAAHLTMTGLTLGTPAYMSPEQGTGSRLDVDTRSDIYSLGVTLYQLLAGVLPFDPNTYRGFAQIAQHATADALPPSARFAELPPDEQTLIASKRHSNAAALRRALAGDLDWIVLKALEKERDHRYETANAFAEDIERHLAFQPVLASPPSRSYRVRKFTRRHRAAVAFAAVAVTMLIGFSAATTVQARRLAAARTVAVTRQAQAEDLIGFMIGDLRPRLQTLARLDLLDEVAKKAQSYFAAVSDAHLSDAELFRRAQALQQLGEVRRDQGKPDAAIQAFRQSLALSEGLARRDTLNGGWQLGLGAAHFWVGRMYYDRNDLDSALAQFVPYLRITERLVARAPDSSHYRMEMGLANSNIGSAKEAKGDLPGALEAYRAKLATLEDLVRRDSTTLDWRVSLANAYNTVAVVQRKMGDFTQAEKNFRAELSVKERLFARDTSNALYRSAVASAHASLGQLLTLEGDVATGLSELDSARATYVSLAERDPTNLDRQRILVGIDQFAALTNLERGDPAAALRDLEHGRHVLEAQTAANPTNRAWALGMGRALLIKSMASLDLGRRAESQAAARSALAILNPLLAKKPSDRAVRFNTSLAFLALGDALAQGRDIHAARDAWTQGVATIDSVARALHETEDLAQDATLLMRLDRRAEAAPLIAELARRRYRPPRWLALVHDKIPTA